MPGWKGKFQVNEKQITALFLGISAVSGIVLFTVFILPRSEPGNQFILGLSISRAFSAAIFLGFLLVNIGAMLITIPDLGIRQEQLQTRLTGLFLSHQVFIMMVLYATLILTGTFLLLVIPPIIRPLSFLESVSARLSSFIGWLFLASLLYIILLRVIDSELLPSSQVVKRLDKFLILAGLFLVVFFLYAHFAGMIGWVNKTKYSFWNLLAEQFIKGKLYLENPIDRHDLTFYNGNWYVPMPPLPAILLMPLAYLIGAQNISTSYLSMVFSAVNGVLLYLILKQLNYRKWINISTIGIFILIALFLFGTPHLWVGISGRGWYVSQILTVLFLALAVYAALRSWSAWLVGSFIAVAMLARPNSLMSWPFVFAISMQILKENQRRVDWKQIIHWSLKTVPPIALAIAGLLTYNYFRFEDIFDFGYATLEGDPIIVNNVQTYGTFSYHFMPNNFYVMFFKLPWIRLGSQWPIEPSATGMSIFLTTPSLIYLFRRYPKQWWIIGAWAAVFFNVILLSLYHTTGMHQFGYRYILDFLVPLIILLGFGMGKKIPWHFILLVLTSIAINLYGANWIMNG